MTASTHQLRHTASGPVPHGRLLGLLALLALVGAGCGPGGPGPGTALDGFVLHLEQAVPSWMEAYGIPGASLALVLDGQTVWSAAFGFSDSRSGRPMELDAVHRVESLSKPVTAWGVMRLLEDGLIELDEPVEVRLSEFRLPPSEFDTRQVTVRRLLSGTAGLPLGTLGAEYVPGATMPSLEESLGREARVTAAPGSGFNYSNPGFNLLELLVQDVTGQDFAVFMEDRILRPLGMVDSGYGWNASLANRIPMGHDLAGETVEHYTYPERGAGGLFATVADMARFVAAGTGRLVRGVHRRFALYGGWDWVHFSSDESGPDGELDVEETGYVLGLRFEHPFRGEVGFPKVRLQAGGTYKHIEIEDEEGDLVAESGLGLGWEAGAGLVMSIAER